MCFYGFSLCNLSVEQFSLEHFSIWLRVEPSYSRLFMVSILQFIHSDIENETLKQSTVMSVHQTVHIFSVMTLLSNWWSTSNTQLTMKHLHRLIKSQNIAQNMIQNEYHKLDWIIWSVKSIPRRSHPIRFNRGIKCTVFFPRRTGVIASTSTVYLTIISILCANRDVENIKL